MYAETDHSPEDHSFLSQSFGFHSEQVGVQSTDFVDGSQCSSGNFQVEFTPECFRVNVLALYVGQPSSASFVVERFTDCVT